MMFKLDFYRGKKVLVTGHTGFKGTWLCKMLVMAGAVVTGYSLEPPTQPNLYDLAGIKDRIVDFYGDVRDYQSLWKCFYQAQPEIVIHMAAQPIVRVSYRNPRETFETNMMGTVNMLECIRNSDCVRSFINVTTDKVYKNKELMEGYGEDAELGGFDPYSNSKSCSELITDSYKKSFFSGEHAPAISTVRSGNVIGGGDFAPDRILPDCIRAIEAGVPLEVRNPYSVRPYQYVLEPLYVYLMIAARQYQDAELAGSYNVGPDLCDCITTGQLVDMFCKAWGNASWISKVQSNNVLRETNFLKLDCSRLKQVFDWNPHWDIHTCISMICQFEKVYLANGDISQEMERQIIKFLQ